jgi:hypothetical protein
MKSARRWQSACLLSLAVCLSLTGCKTAPKIEVCIIGDAGLLCFDPRKPDGEREYTRTYLQSYNYIATNPHDFQTLIEYCERRGK